VGLAPGPPPAFFLSQAWISSEMSVGRTEIVTNAWLTQVAVVR